MDNNKEEILEKIKEINYIRLNFQSKLRILAFMKDKIIQNVINKLDSQNLKKIREELNKEYEK
jgi:hypothetical protein